MLDLPLAIRRDGPRRSTRGWIARAGWAGGRAARRGLMATGRKLLTTVHWLIVRFNLGSVGNLKPRLEFRDARQSQLLQQVEHSRLKASFSRQLLHHRIFEM